MKTPKLRFGAIGLEPRRNPSSSAVMDNALIIGASGGIGRALGAALTERGVKVTGLTRSGDSLDITNEASVAEVLGRLAGPFDLIFVATGALEINGAEPEKTLKSLEAAAMMDQFAVNCIGPSLVLKHSLALMPRKGRAVFAALSARVGSIGDNAKGGWYSYRTAKAALNQMIHTGAIELARTHRQAICVALHPGTVRTPFTEKYLDRHPAVAASEAAGNLLSVIDGLTPAQSGQFFDWQGKPVAW
ncbi:NAD(P)-dependent dehydrogenase, short-chain alcohol dehydrogenase family [Roseovarius marisflavi]|uniref:NAD(P)-dependent dehydrogenase, short-chain alcohol dehydrogenase family n=2 Tax=Roseovarius marisflavi TaxID=1054996 RepID=A0A1M6W4H4_9RHOB|nr:NAD(P)-dependent dehydrogenase, short-chain alcohol dehydrogenase family [Roseovarius marisflavi]